MSGNGMTVTPSIMVGDDGQEYVSYSEADVSSTSGREQALDHFLHNQEDLYSYDEQTGQVTHNYSDFEPEYDEYLEEFAPEPFEDNLPDTDVDSIFESIGGEENYRSMISWAFDNLPADVSQQFDELLDTGDMEAILEAVQSLYSIYLDGEYVAPEEDYEYDEDESELSADDQSFVNSVYAAFGGSEEYANATDWASVNWSPDVVRTYDRAMESGDPEIMSKAVDLLYSAYMNDY